MTTLQQVPETYDQAVCLLARWHGESGASDLQIHAFTDPDQQVVRLAHVSDTFPDLGGVHVYRMGRSEEFPFKSAVVLVTPTDWQRIQAGVPLLPQDWNPQTAKKVWPE